MQLVTWVLRSRLAVAVLGALVAAGVGSIAWASIPGGDGVIHGCYKNEIGSLRVIDAGETCLQSETAIEWSERGPQGEQGPPGLVPDQSCPAGKFVTGVVGGVIQCAGLPEKTQLSFSILLSCTSSGQLCEPPYVASFSAASVAALKVRFTAGPLWCSYARVHFRLDGTLVYTSSLMTHDETTGWVSLGTIPAGGHQLSLQGEGVVGGCNTGQLYRWEGTLEVETTEG